jgi:hypothetical protein
MTMRQRFITALVALGEVFRVEVTDAMAETYWRALRELPIEGLEGGARELIRTARFFPRPVEWGEAAEDWLRERCRETRAHRARLAQSTAPPLDAADVRKLVDELAARLGWPR